MCTKRELICFFKNSNDRLKKQKSKNNTTKDLQLILQGLGFKKELGGDNSVDGVFGDYTQKALQLFLAKNNQSSDGSFVDKKIAELMLKRYDSLDDLQVLADDIDKNAIEQNYFYKSSKKSKVQALQTLLNELGYGELLQWNKYQNDGDYGNLTSKALSQFAKDNRITSDGKKLTNALAKKIVEILSKFYGNSWREKSLNEIVESKKNSLVEFTASNFIGNRVSADSEFVPALKRINQYAVDSNVWIHINSSFRKDSNVSNAIVTPSKMSNHMVGHAIDFNLRYGTNQEKWIKSRELFKNPLPEPAKTFITFIRNDGELRWGGDFRTKDPIHIDDHFNKDPEKWKKKFIDIRKV